MRFLFLSTLCIALAACNGSQTDQPAEPVPFQQATDSTSLQQYIGTWQSDCVVEVLHNYPPTSTTPTVYTVIRYVISEAKAEKTIHRYSDDQCTQNTDSTRGYRFYHRSIALSTINISNGEVDAESGLVFGLLEGTVSSFKENNAPVTDYTTPINLSWPIYRGQDTLYTGEYYYRSGGGYYTLDTDVDLYFLGDPDFLSSDL